MLRLNAIDGPEKGRFAVIVTETIVGRNPGPGMHMRVSKDAQASERHCVFIQAGGSWAVRDLGSGNGTWVNGARVQEAYIRPGDQIRIGGTIFVADIGADLSNPVTKKRLLIVAGVVAVGVLVLISVLLMGRASMGAVDADIERFERETGAQAE